MNVKIGNMIAPLRHELLKFLIGKIESFPVEIKTFDEGGVANGAGETVLKKELLGMETVLLVLLWVLGRGFYIVEVWKQPKRIENKS